MIFYLNHPKQSSQARCSFISVQFAVKRVESQQYNMLSMYIYYLDNVNIQTTIQSSVPFLAIPLDQLSYFFHLQFGNVGKSAISPVNNLKILRSLHSHQTIHKQQSTLNRESIKLRLNLMFEVCLNDDRMNAIYDVLSLIELLKIRCNLFIQVSIQLDKPMLDNQPSSQPPFQHQSDLRHLQMQLEDQKHELHSKQAKIFELQNFISHTHNTSNVRDSLKEEQTQCSLDSDSSQEQADLSIRQSETLHPRQQQAQELRMPSKQIEEENTKLKVALQQKEEETTKVKAQVQVLEGYLQSSVRDLEFLCSQNKIIQQRVCQLEDQQKFKDQKLSQLPLIRMELEKLESQKNTVQQKLKTEEQRSLRLVSEVESLRKQLEIQVGEVQQKSDVLKTYEWKLGYLLNQLELLTQQTKKLKLNNQTLGMRLTEFQGKIAQQQGALFTRQEEIRLLQNHNRYLTTEMERRQQRIEDQRNLLKKSFEEMQQKIEAQRDLLKKSFEEMQQKTNQAFKVLQKEKELDLKALYLKQKEEELDQIKLHENLMDRKVSDMEAKLKQKQHQNQELQQSVAEHDQIMKKQSNKIAQLQNDIESASKIIEDSSMLSVLRASEWRQLRNSLETIIQGQTQKINHLNLLLVQKDRLAQDNTEKIQDAHTQLERVRLDLVRSQTKLSQNERLLTESKLKEQKLAQLLFITNKKNLEQQVSLLQTKKYINYLQDELKNVSEQKEKLKNTYEELITQLGHKNEEISALRDKVIEFIQAEVNYEFETAELRKQVEAAENRYAITLDAKNKKQNLLDKMQGEGKQLHTITQLRIQQMTQLLSQLILDIESPEESVKFELMEREDQVFEVMQCKYSKRKNQLKEKIEQYKAQVLCLVKNLTAEQEP